MSGSPGSDAGDEALTDAQRKLVERAMPRVRSLARALAHRLRATVEDLESIGNEGLVDAVTRYDPASGTPFAAFAHYRIRGAMIDAARRRDPALARHGRALRALEATQALLTQAQKAESTPTQADPRSLRERIEAAAAVVAQTTTAVLMSRMRADPDELAAGDADAEARLLEGEQAAVLRDEVSACSDDDRALLDALYRRGLTMGEYAASIGKSKSTVSRHHARVLGRLGSRVRRRLGDTGPPPAGAPDS